MASTDTQLDLLNCTESKLIKYLGAAPEVLADYRKNTLVEGEDWARGHFNRVQYLAPGIEKVLVAFGVHTEVPTDTAVYVTVKSLPVNQHLLIASLPDGREVKVRVQSQHNFMRGMQVPVFKEGDIFAYKGHQPRIKGRL